PFGESMCVVAYRCGSLLIIFYGLRLMEHLQQNCAQLLAKLPAHVRLIAASKTRTIAEVRAAFQEGIRHFGENYVQEGAEKAQALPEATWHFIGKLQKNKVNHAIRAFSVFHTVDSETLLNKLHNAAEREGVTPV